MFAVSVLILAYCIWEIFDKNRKLPLMAILAFCGFFSSVTVARYVTDDEWDRLHSFLPAYTFTFIILFFAFVVWGIFLWSKPAR
jgi:hypothetical protein